MDVLEHMKGMSPDRFLAIYKSLEHQGFGPLDGDVARSLRFRPQAIRKLPMEQRAKRARMLVESSKNANLAYELVGGYLMKTQKELVIGFLEATGVPHKDGMIEDIEGAKPKSEAIAGAVEELDRKFAPEDVTLYLVLCADQWPTEKVFAELLARRLGAGPSASTTSASTSAPSTGPEAAAARSPGRKQA